MTYTSTLRGVKSDLETKLLKHDTGTHVAPDLDWDGTSQKLEMGRLLVNHWDTIYVYIFNFCSLLFFCKCTEGFQCLLYFRVRVDLLGP